MEGDPAQQELQNKGVMLNMENFQNNMRKISVVSTIMYIVGGIVSGILGLTGVQGLIVALFTAALSTLALSVKMGFDVLTYTNTSPLSFMLSGAQANSMSFLLFWTLTYALVHIY